MALDIHLFPCLEDNYGFLIRDAASGKVATIDTPEVSAITAQLDVLGWGRIDYIFNTHWHPDHTAGNAELKALFGCEIYGPEEVRKRAPLDHVVRPQDTVKLGDTAFEIMDLRGHTAGQIGYVNHSENVAFVGDALFVLGCGRLREGTPADMWQSLVRLSAMPDDTLIYSAHEYALTNLAFAESLEADSLDKDGVLTAYADKIRNLRTHGKPTVPARLGDEITANPFLRFPLREASFAAQAARFGDLRALKDRFTG